MIERGYVADGKISEQDLDRALDVLSMTHPPSPEPTAPVRTGGLVLRAVLWAVRGRQGQSRAAVTPGRRDPGPP